MGYGEGGLGFGEVWESSCASKSDSGCLRADELGSCRRFLTGMVAAVRHVSMVVELVVWVIRLVPCSRYKGTQFVGIEDESTASASP